MNGRIILAVYFMAHAVVNVLAYVWIIHSSDVRRPLTPGCVSPAGTQTGSRQPMAASAADPMAAGVPGLVALLNIRPSSESVGNHAAWLQYLRAECGSIQAVAAIESAESQWGDGQYSEWVTATSSRPGVIALKKPGELGEKQRAGTIVRMVLRRVLLHPATAGPVTEFLRKSGKSGEPQAVAFIIPVPMPDVVPTAFAVDPTDELRSDAPSMQRLFIDARAHKQFIECMQNMLSTAILQAQTFRGKLNASWGLMSELMTKAAPGGPEPPEISVSTHWNPLENRSRRPDHPADLLIQGCCCGSTLNRFPVWVMKGCSVGIFRFRASLTKDPAEFLASLQHDVLFQLLSQARANPITPNCIFRGFIDEKENNIFRVAAQFDDTDTTTNNWHATLKHHLAFVVHTEALRGNLQEKATPAKIWAQGVLLLILSAPRSRGGKWRITFGTPSPLTGDCVLVVLSWVGNTFFGHEALRRGTLNTMLPTEDNVNVLRGIITMEAIEAYVAAAGVRLDEEQCRVLSSLNSSPATLLGITALAGAGKSVLAHCVIKAFIATHAGASPRRLVLYTVPTRALREEVVLDLIKFKACVVS